MFRKEGVSKGNVKKDELNKCDICLVQIRSFFWSVFSCIQSEYKKIRTRKTSIFGHFSRSVKLPAVNFYHKELHLGCGSSPRSASHQGYYDLRESPLLSKNRDHDI